jgi:hypothetical protein
MPIAKQRETRDWAYKTVFFADFIRPFFGKNSFTHGSKSARAYKTTTYARFIRPKGVKIN